MSALYVIVRRTTAHRQSDTITEIRQILDIFFNIKCFLYNFHTDVFSGKKPNQFEFLLVQPLLFVHDDLFDDQFEVLIFFYFLSL